eukprot:scaffold536_cov42-Phaeocystis_antarctica.AAC.1
MACGAARSNPLCSAAHASALAGPEGSTAGKWAALEAASSSARGSGLAPDGPASRPVSPRRPKPPGPERSRRSRAGAPPRGHFAVLRDPRGHGQRRLRPLLAPHPGRRRARPARLKGLRHASHSAVQTIEGRARLSLARPMWHPRSA